jgi:uncharacterized protein YndB with AHSA1/START domain
MHQPPITVRRLLQAPATAVWQALTDADAMREWYFNLPAFRAEVGFRFEFTGGPEDRQYLHRCEVTEVIPGRRLTYSWRYDGYPGISYVSFELAPQEDGTMLTLTHTGLETISPGHADFARSNFEAGWDDIINRMLKEHVEKEPTA